MFDIKRLCIYMKTVSMGEVMLHFFINPKCLFNNVIVLFYSLDSWRKCKNNICPWNP